ncbi:MAG: uroporphyrinogen-III C-methyltransferase [Alphaproteobacteria bacterium]|nr:uroporphyrinogen-III C-methyltransferase [Alphaproteobacteria bacterium]
MKSGEIQSSELDTLATAAGSQRAGLAPWALGLALLACVMAGVLWIKLSSVQELLARQTSDSGLLATEARSSARQAEELARDNAARLALAEAKITEINLQRTQLDQLMQSLSRARDENLVADFESALRLAEQQTQLTGSLQPLVAALRTVEQRLGKQANPRFSNLQRAVTRDLERLTAVSLLDTPGMLVRLDGLIAQLEDLPLLNAVGVATSVPASDNLSSGWQRAISSDWWGRVLSGLWDDVRGLVRISRIDQPDAALLAPEQSFFLRENLKLRMLNARLGLLSRQFDSARMDLQTTQRDLTRYFDTQNRLGKQALEQLQQMQSEIKQVKLPRIDETFTALETLAAGR